MRKTIQNSAATLAHASKGNPAIALCVIFILWFVFNLVEGVIEKLLYGEPFTHWFDIVIGVAVFTYSVYTVWVCSEVNSGNNKKAKTK